MFILLLFESPFTLPSNNANTTICLSLAVKSLVVPGPGDVGDPGPYTSRVRSVSERYRFFSHTFHRLRTVTFFSRTSQLRDHSENIILCTITEDGDCEGEGVRDAWA